MAVAPLYCPYCAYDATVLIFKAGGKIAPVTGVYVAGRHSPLAALLQVALLVPLPSPNWDMWMAGTRPAPLRTIPLISRRASRIAASADWSATARSRVFPAIRCSMVVPVMAVTPNIVRITRNKSATMRTAPCSRCLNRTCFIAGLMSGSAVTEVHVQCDDASYPGVIEGTDDGAA